eukprot:scaffold68_cov128-Isochrysis_galbana.AAC.4
MWSGVEDGAGTPAGESRRICRSASATSSRSFCASMRMSSGSVAGVIADDSVEATLTPATSSPTENAGAPGPHPRLVPARLGIAPAEERAGQSLRRRHDERGVRGGQTSVGGGQPRGTAESGEQVDHEGPDRAGVGHVQELVRHAGEQLRVQFAAQADGGHRDAPGTPTRINSALAKHPH